MFLPYEKVSLNTAEQQPDGEYSDDHAGKIRGERAGNGVAGFPHVDGTEIHRDGVKGGFRGPHHYRRHPSGKAVHPG